MTTYGTETSGASGSDEGLKEKGAGAAADVGEGAKNVAGVAKDEATHVAHEAKSAARGLLYDARAQLVDQASSQKQRAADGLRDVGTQLSSMAAGAQSGPASSIVRNLSRRAESAANWLSDREPTDIVQDVRSFARRNTGIFLAVAAGIGIVAGRVAKALHSGDPEEGGEHAGSRGAPRPIAAGAGSGYDDTPVATAVASGQGLTGDAIGAGPTTSGYEGAPVDAGEGDPWAAGGAQGDRP